MTARPRKLDVRDPEIVGAADWIVRKPLGLDRDPIAVNAGRVSGAARFDHDRRR